MSDNDDDVGGSSSGGVGSSSGAAEEEEPFGTTPLPTSVSGSPVKVTFDDAVFALERAQQPQAQSIATFEFKRNDTNINGTIVDANAHFVVYVVKNGLIRVLHRHTTLRSLLRGHKGDNNNVTDVRFFRNGDVLATVGHHSPPPSAGAGAGGGKSTVMIWRIFTRDTEILSEVLLEISSVKTKITRVVWHPFNVNQFWMVHTDSSGRTIATLVETTRIATRATSNPEYYSGAGGGGGGRGGESGGTSLTGQTSHAVCDFYDDYTVMRGAVQVNNNNSGQNYFGDLTDLCWSLRENRHVLTCHETGEIVLWDLKRLSPASSAPVAGGGLVLGDNAAASAVVVPAIVSVIRTDDKLSRRLFVPHEYAFLPGKGSNNNEVDTLTTCFVTAADNNKVITVWSPFPVQKPVVAAGTSSLPSRVQVLEFANPASSYLIDACYYGAAPADAAPPSCFLVVAARDEPGKIFAFSLKSKWIEAASAPGSSAVTAASAVPAPGNNINNNSTVKKAQQLVGCDYVVPFVTKYPTYAWSTMVLATTDIADDEIVSQEDGTDSDGAGAGGGGRGNGGSGGLIFDMQLFCAQKSAAQILKLTALSCLPPENSWVDPTPGVRYQRLFEDARSAHVSDIDSRDGGDASDMDLVFDEDDYDIDEDADGGDGSGGNGGKGDDGEGGEFDDAPEPSALPPPPDGFVASGSAPGSAAPGPTPLANNPFANWLGSIARTTAPGAAASAAAPVATMPVLTAPTNRPGPVATAATAAVTAAGAIQPAAPPPPPGLGLAPDVSGPAAAPAAATVQDDQLPPSAPIEQPEEDQSLLAGLLKGSMSKKTSPNNNVPPPKPVPEKKQQQKQTGKKKQKGRSKSPKPPPQAVQPPGAKVAILKRDEIPGDSKAEPAKDHAKTAPAPQTSSKEIQVITKEDVRHAVRDEFRDSILPHLEKMIQKSLNVAVVLPLQTSISQLRKDGVKVDTDAIASSLAESADAPLRAAFADNVKNVLIPTLESVTTQAFAQISEHLEEGLSSKQIALQTGAAGASKDMAAISTQLTTMTSLVAKLTNEVQSLRTTVEAQQAMISSASASGGPSQPATPAQPALRPEEVARNKVVGLLKNEEFEAAFHAAIGAQIGGLVSLCCANADINAIFGGDSPRLSQMMMLCVMQQLVADFGSKDSTTLEREMEWLQTIALCLDPTDAQIKTYVPRVQQEVVNGVSQRLAQTTDPTLRRKLQHLTKTLQLMHTG